MYDISYIVKIWLRFRNFLTPPAEVRIKVNRVSANGGYLCENIQNGVFSLILEGKGDRTEISRITDET